MFWIDQHRFEDAEYGGNEHGTSFNNDIPTSTRTNILFDEKRLFPEIFKIQAIQTAAMPLTRILYYRCTVIYRKK